MLFLIHSRSQICYQESGLTIRNHFLKFFERGKGVLVGKFLPTLQFYIDTLAATKVKTQNISCHMKPVKAKSTLFFIYCCFLSVETEKSNR